MQRNDDGAVLFAAILADIQGEAEVRDSLLRELQKVASHPTIMEFMNLLAGVLSGEERGQWNPRTFDYMVVNAPTAEIPDPLLFRRNIAA